MIKTINLQLLKKEQLLQSRVELNQEVVQDYHEKMIEGDKFPPLTVIFDSVNYYLVDGYHRFYAYIKSKMFDVECDVIDGTYRDAVLKACSVNSVHGLRRTNADKRKAVETLLNDEEWRNWSNVKIAEVCSVDEKFVRSLRISEVRKSEISQSDTPKLTIYVNKHGQEAVMNVSNIGKKKPDNFTMMKLDDCLLDESLRKRLIGTKYYNHLPSLNFIASLDTHYDQSECIDAIIKMKIRKVTDYLHYNPKSDVITDPSHPDFSALGRVKPDRDVVDLKNDILNILQAYNNAKSERCRYIVAILTEYINYQIT